MIYNEKIIKVYFKTNGQYTITLPKKIAESHDIKHGSLLKFRSNSFDITLEKLR